jgi:hypothetical protein
VTGAIEVDEALVCLTFWISSSPLLVRETVLIVDRIRRALILREGYYVGEKQWMNFEMVIIFGSVF